MAVQLATYLGDHRMFQHIMRKRSAVLWVWGPVTMYQVSLAGIDSVSDGDNDVMNLVARADALDKTKAMLGDNFMLGFLHERFEDKWERFGRFVWITMQMFDACFVISLAFLSVNAKMLPHYSYDHCA